MEVFLYLNFLEKSSQNFFIKGLPIEIYENYKVFCELFSKKFN